MTQPDVNPEGQGHLESASAPTPKVGPRWYLWLALIIKQVALLLLVVFFFDWLF